VEAVADQEQQCLEITPPSDLQRRYDRYPGELQPPRGQRLVLSTEVAAFQRALEQSRRQDSSRPELGYLWDLNPLVDGWLIAGRSPSNATAHPCSS
jgi:hypothetical protein